MQNYVGGWTALNQPFTTFFINSIVVCGLSVMGNLLSCSLAAYAFARLRFPLRNLLFGGMLLRLMLPHQATIVPQYVLFKNLGWLGTFLRCSRRSSSQSTHFSCFC